MKKKAVKKVKKIKPKKAKPAKLVKIVQTKKQVKAAQELERKAKLKEKAQKKPKGFVAAFLGLGSNVGDREEYIEQAVFLLSKTPGIKIGKRSSNYESEPEGVTNQPAFINAVLEIKTKLSPDELLGVCQDTENTLGREREVEWGPRAIDVDILFYDAEVISTDTLTIPHPLLHERIFVLEPLKEIAPNFMHPILEKDVSLLYEEKKLDLVEKYDDELPGFKNIKSGMYDDFERW